ncbi:PsiF family protein [Rhodoferax sp.]|uniref:PsiF family protein n=1 Tax=Rhodoferax sp. TaxID=50421 RepID=UPI00374DA1A1
MKKLFPLIAALGLAFSLGTVHAADKEKTPQQMKMTTCNADAKTKALKGDERKKFMSECLSAKADAPAAASDGKTAQQNKMTTCNADAKTKALKGDDRKKFMSDCLKG